MKQEETSEITEADIYRTAVPGFVVTESTINNKHRFVGTEPIYNSPDNDGVINIADDCKVIGVLPALPNTYRVYGHDNDGYIIELGYEHPGEEHPDWVEKLRTIINV